MEGNMKYDVIIFDADGTIFDFEMAEKNAFEKTMNYFGINSNDDNYMRIYKEINSELWDEYEKKNITAERLKIERFKRFFIKIKSDYLGDEGSKVYLGFLSKGAFLLDGALELLQELESKVNMILLTNGFTNVQKNRLELSGIRKFFSTVVISEEVGFAKPHIKIFEYGLKNAPYVSRKKVLMVGDSLKSDILGGINFGIDTCWYNPKVVSNKSKINPTYEIKDFESLRKIIL
jgi:2-haloacid dehalogenase